MLRNIALAAGIVVAFAAPAYADCAGDIAKAEQAFATAELNDEDKAAVNASLAAAREKASDEQACQDELALAKDILGIE